MKSRHLFFPILAATGLAACSPEVSQDEAVDPEGTETGIAEAEASTAGPASPEADATQAVETSEAAPNPYASGRPGQPAIPETVEDPNWTNRYSPDVPYYNRSDRPIPATMGASPRTALVGQVMPNDGGFIQTCELNSSYCKITFGGNGKAGYVNMDLLSGEAR